MTVRRTVLPRLFRLPEGPYESRARPHIDPDGGSPGGAIDQITFSLLQSFSYPGTIVDVVRHSPNLWVISTGAGGTYSEVAWLTPLSYDGGVFTVGQSLVVAEGRFLHPATSASLGDLGSPNRGLFCVGAYPTRYVGMYEVIGLTDGRPSEFRAIAVTSTGGGDSGGLAIPGGFVVGLSPSRGLYFKPWEGPGTACHVSVITINGGTIESVLPPPFNSQGFVYGVFGENAFFGLGIDDSRALMLASTSTEANGTYTYTYTARVVWLDGNIYRNGDFVVTPGSGYITKLQDGRFMLTGGGKVLIVSIDGTTPTIDEDYTVAGYGPSALTDSGKLILRMESTSILLQAYQYQPPTMTSLNTVKPTGLFGNNFLRHTEQEKIMVLMGSSLGGKHYQVTPVNVNDPGTPGGGVGIPRAKAMAVSGMNRNFRVPSNR